MLSHITPLILVFVVPICLWVLMVITTPYMRTNWIQAPQVRMLWTVILFFVSLYILYAPSIHGDIMKLHTDLPRWSYAIAALAGAIFMCVFWYITGLAINQSPNTIEDDTMAHYRAEFFKLQPSQIEALRKMNITHNANDVSDSDWLILENAGFVERNFTGKIGIKTELKQLVAQLLKEKVEPLPPKQPISLYQVFEDDLLFKYHSSAIIGDAVWRTPNNTVINYKGTVAADFSSHAKFIALYLPFTQFTYEFCKFFADHFQEMLDTSQPHSDFLQIYPGEGGVSSDKLTFTGLIYVYFDGMMTEDEISDLKQIFKLKGVTVQFRGKAYLETECLRRKIEGEPGQK
jgi:hypothetical protein